jgi:RHS repeat-associated protein
VDTTTRRLNTIHLYGVSNYQYGFTYANAGKLSVATLTAGTAQRSVTMSVDGTGRLTQFTDPDATTEVMTFDTVVTAPRRVATQTDARGTVSRYGYDAGGKLANSRLEMQGQGSDIVLGFQAQETRGLAPAANQPPGAPAWTTDTYTLMGGPRVDSTIYNRFWLDRWGGPRKIVNARGDATAVVVRGDPRFPGLVTRVVGSNGYTQVSEHDERGNVRSVTRLNPYGDGRNATTRYEYGDSNWLDFPTRVVNPEGDSTVSAFDAAGNRAWQQDGRGDSTRVYFSYDGEGRVTSVRSQAAINRSEPATTVTYDAVLGNVKRVTSPLGFYTETFEDGFGRDTLVDAPGNDATHRLLAHAWYDAADQDTLTITSGDATEGNLHVRTVRDPGGLTTTISRWSSTAPTRKLTNSWTRDPAGRAWQEVREDGTTLTSAFDLAGNDTAQTDPRATVRIAYDALDRPTRRIVPAKTYAATSFVLSEASTNQAFYTATFPNPAIMASPVTIPGDTAEFRYDPLTGAMVAADNRDAQVRRTYYPNGQLKTDTLHIRTWTVTGAAGEFDQHVYAIAHTYDLDGRPVTLRHPSTIAPRNGTTSQLYDLEQYAYEPGSGALSQVTGVLGTQYGFFYDAEGRTDSISYPGNRYEKLRYDADSRLAERYDAAWNWNGTVGSVPHDIDRVSWTYDERGKALDIDGNNTTSNTYSLLGSLRTTTSTAYHPMSPADLGPTRYVVNALGLRLQEQHVGDSTPTDYEYDGASGRMTGSHPATSYYGSGAGTMQSFRYDAAGNQEEVHAQQNMMSMIDHTRSFYGGDEKLRMTDRQSCDVKEVSGSGPNRFACTASYALNNGTSGAFEWYRYDALGRRVLARTRRDKACTSTSCASTITRFVWNGDQILYEVRAPGGNVSDSDLEDDNAQGAQYGRVAYTHGGGIDQPLEITRMGYTPAVSASFGLDAWNGPYPVVPYAAWNGSFEGATTATGMRVPCVQTAYLCGKTIWPGSSLDPYHAATETVDKQIWFGSLTDEKVDGSGLKYMRNRYYNPVSGTFTQPDPMGIAGGLNAYGFADGDPVSYSDPYGLCTEADHWTGCSVADLLTFKLEVGVRVGEEITVGGVGVYMNAQVGPTVGIEVNHADPYGELFERRCSYQ